MDVPRATPVQLTVYDMRGRYVRTLLTSALASGTYHAVWDGTDVDGRDSASGTYIARLQVGAMQATRKMVLVR